MEAEPVLTRLQRLVLGSFILILVDIIWVSSSELTKYIYHNETFEKPFFCTYIKTSMFTLYLIGLCFWKPWQEHCYRPSHYMFLDVEEDDNFYSEANTSLSTPTYIPLKTPDGSELVSSSDSDATSVRSVRFSKLAEVRQMSDEVATEALLARLSYQASVRASDLARRAASRLPLEKIAKLAFGFCLLWFCANYTYQLALADTEAGVVNVLSSTSSLFTLALAAMFPSTSNDKFTLSKLVCVCLSISGTVLVSYTDIMMQHRVPHGVSLSILSAFFYAAYIVFLRMHVDHEDKMDIPLFFGFVGLFNIFLLWPIFFILHYSEYETFEWPTKHQLIFLLMNGLFGTVVSEVLWLWGCFLTSSLIATIAISLTIPMTMFADVIVKKISYQYLFYVGTVPIALAFVFVSILSHYENWDPVYNTLRLVYTTICRRRNRLRFPEFSAEQTEALIGINSNEHEA
ncbi:solute carrier family 35 member F5 isoform X2 [Onthophagus taurus]|uniref:solute carrier family 35 member F5 isoform X2 n=1 Tax=Onthophagus taurus TaxID=166361 RepID=UPI000C2022C2|nr:solute carrier family 35 member F5 isoform X2 [Onthophagus taurus]